MAKKRQIALSKCRVEKVCGSYYITIPPCSALPEGAEFILDELTGIPNRHVTTIARYIGRALKAYKPTKQESK